MRLLVGVARFELTTSWSQTKRDTGLRYTPNCFWRRKDMQTYQFANFVIPAGFEPATYCLAYHFDFHRSRTIFGICGLDYIFTVSGVMRIVSTELPYNH